MIRRYLARRRMAFGYAFKGIRSLFRNEAHARIHLVAAVAVVAAGFAFGIDAAEWALVSLCIGGVFMAEGFNTAVEKLADRISGEKDPLIGTAKDVAAGAVLLFVMAAVVVGLLVFVPHIRDAFA